MTAKFIKEADMTQKTELAPDTLGQASSRLYDGYIFDLGGTIYLGKSLLPGAYRMITKLRELNKRVVFLSNNPTRDVDMYLPRRNGCFKMRQMRWSILSAKSRSNGRCVKPASECPRIRRRLILSLSAMTEPLITEKYRLRLMPFGFTNGPK